MGAGKPTSIAPPRSVVSRQVVAQHAPAQPPTPFAQRQDKRLVRPVAPVKQSFAPSVAKSAPVDRTEPTPVERPIQQTPKPEWQAPRPQPGQPVRTSEANNSYSNTNNNHPANSQQTTQPSSQQGWSHPQARPAPPVQPKTETQARDEETKYKNWQAKPQPARPSQERPAPPKEDKKK